MADQAILEWSCTKLRSAISDEATSFTVDLQEMLDMLVDIQAVTTPDDIFKWAKNVRTAEEWEKNVRTAEEWAKNVRTAAYGVSDLVDELKMQPARTPPAAGKTTKRMDLPENKIKEIKEKLDGLLKESIEFNVVDARIIASNPTITVPPDAIVGRDEDRKKIFARLSARCPSEGPIIHLISGEKGVGKTTVAEMVFTDARFRSYSRVWVNMSVELDDIGKSIISQLSGDEEMSHASEDNMDAITDRLHELLNGMKVLVVLDDLFMGYGEWEPLKLMFTLGGDKDSHIIVIATTTQTRTDSVIQSYILDPLSDDMCCTIIKHLACHSEDRSTKMDLERLAPEIAKLCEGLPLAAKLFGRLLKFRDYEEWPTLLDKGRWSTYDPVELSLELIYRSMPPNLRLCLDYCTFSTVPSLPKEDLIHQWIALGLIETSDGIISAIKLAEEYIVRLLDLSILQTAKLPQVSY